MLFSLVQSRRLAGLGLLIVAWSICSFTLVSSPLVDDDPGSGIHKTATRSKLPRKHSGQTIRSRSTLTMGSDICTAPPTYDLNGEVNHIGYHNLLVTRESLQELAEEDKHSSVRVLCIFPPIVTEDTDMNPNEEISVLARSTFGRECDGHVFVAGQDDIENLPLAGPLEYPLSQLRSRSQSDTISQLIHHALEIQGKNGENFDWFYIMPTKAPYQYFLAARARRRLTGLSGTESPMRLRSIRWSVDKLPPSLKEQEATGLCEPVGILNRPALQELLRQYDDTNRNNNNSKTVPSLEYLAQSVPCVKGWAQRKVKNPHKYSELTLPSTVNHTHHAFHRIRHILDGTCDGVWKKRDAVVALDERGRRGYRHDATEIVIGRNTLQASLTARNYFLESSDVCQTPPGAGPEGPNGAKALDKIQVAKTHQNVKVLCMVYTHESRHDRLLSIVETWGKDCDGFFAASTKTDPSLGAINLLHEGEEVYENMWLKVRAMWQYAYDHYRDEYDYFTIGGDDHFFIPANFRYMTQVGNWAGPYNASQPWFLGGSVADPSDRAAYRYCGGGSGYSLNRKALNVLIEDLFDKSDCWPHWKASDEDRIISSCFRSIGIQCFDTNDARNETRYHPWNAEWHSTWTHSVLANYFPRALEKGHGIAQLERMGQISTSTVSFHLKPTEPDPTLPPDSGMRRYYALLHGMCKKEG